jgi:ATP-dependent DNA helicase RecG
LIEKWGIGTNKMIALCKEDSLPAPYFEEYSGGISVIFEFREPIGMTHQTIPAKTSLSMRQQEILNTLQGKTSLSASAIFAELKEPPSLRTVKADLSRLQELGLIEQQGKGRSTVWKIRL